MRTLYSRTVYSKLEYQVSVKGISLGLNMVEAKQKLTRDKIVAAGLDIVRRHGEEALSMRRVAQELNSGTMSLYRHVRDRDDLLGGMLDSVALSIEHPPAYEEPSEEVLAIFMTLHQEFMREPWLLNVVIEGRRGSPHILPLLERAFVALRRLTGSDEEMVRLYFLLLHYCYGDVRAKVGYTKFQEAGPEAGPGPPDFTKFPVMMQASATAQKLQGDYEFNVRRILASVRSASNEHSPD